MKAFILSASILSADFSCLRDQIQEIEAAGVDWIHIDVMDGQFVPNITMGPFMVETFRRITKLPLDVHLMIDYPERHVDAFAQAGADRISIHIESSPNTYRTLEHIRSLGVKPGIVLNPATPVSSIESVLPVIEMILVMTVNPGYSGQKFNPAMIKKVAQTSVFCKNQPDLLIQVDGGITSETLPPVYDAGARVIVAATAIFKFPTGIAAGIQTLRQSIV